MNFLCSQKHCVQENEQNMFFLSPVLTLLFNWDFAACSRGRLSKTFASFKVVLGNSFSIFVRTLKTTLREDGMKIQTDQIASLPIFVKLLYVNKT